MTGKIIKGIAGFYYVHDGHGKVYECKAKGVFRNRKIKPLVGDNAEFSVLDESGRKGNIDRILPRKNSLIRPAVANVDQALLVFTLAEPTLNQNLLERFLVMMGKAEIPTYICFNKLDLCPSTQWMDYLRIYEGAGYRVYGLSVKEEVGIEGIKELIRGKTTVLAGPSGVGKSSLMNFIQPEAGMETGEISEKIKRGKHTTRHSQLFYVEESTFMMDTPGFSSLYLEGLEADSLQEYFPEFFSYRKDCKFPGCVHIGERVCGVKSAVEAGKVNRKRYENYRLPYQELKEKRRY